MIEIYCEESFPIWLLARVRRFYRPTQRNDFSLSTVNWQIRWASNLDALTSLWRSNNYHNMKALPRQGHLDTAYHIFAYLKKHEHGACIVFDPKEPQVDLHAFNTDADWSDFYGKVMEELPPHIPETKGKPVMTSCFVDANHAGNVVTRCSHTGILLYVNNAPVQWYSKQQNTVESSGFWREFVALCIVKEMTVLLDYKPRMFGAPIVGATNVLCDNNAQYSTFYVTEETQLSTTMLYVKLWQLGFYESERKTERPIWRICLARS
jgi:hypothetical protein